ncbi:MAG: twin-arginine translocase TatA/TatE family subunit [Anaerolineae bacterium]
MLPQIGMPELLVLLVIIIIIFGVGRLPEVGGALGKAIREFRQSSQGLDEETKSEEEKSLQDPEGKEEA